MELSDEQLRVVDLVLAGHNVLFTGPGGSGKSLTTNAIIERLRERHGEAFAERVAVTATTGIAATHIGGTTVNAAMGLGVPTTRRDFRTMHASRNRLRAYEVLIVDEIGMMSDDTFDALEETLREVRQSMQPFGGLQVVVTGDPFQLPPIARRRGEHDPPDALAHAGYFFQGRAWGACRFRVVVLSRIFRQVDDTFTGLLNAIRHGGEAGRAAMAALARRCARPLACEDGIQPTQIFSRNVDVDACNAGELARLPGAKRSFRARDEVVVCSTLRREAPTQAAAARAKLLKADFFRSCQAAETVELAAGAQVMLVKNLSTKDDLVNGARGVVEGFEPGTGHPLVRFRRGNVVALPPARFSSVMSGLGECFRTQVPLKLAWALSCHKSQGCTLDYARVSLRGVFAPGQAYVALSRARSIDGLQVVDAEGGCVRVDAAVTAFYDALVEQSRRDADAAVSPPDRCLFIDDE